MVNREPGARPGSQRGWRWRAGISLDQAPGDGDAGIAVPTSQDSTSMLAAGSEPVVSTSGPQPSWHQGPVLWKTVFPRIKGRGGGGFEMTHAHYIYCACTCPVA